MFGPLPHSRACNNNRMKIELKPQFIALTQAILSAHLSQSQLQAFGSRTMGHAKTLSDPDLAVLDDLRFSDRERATARYALNECALPIRVYQVRWLQPPQSLRSVIELTDASFNVSYT
jgi:hypothetical protein